MALRYFNKKGGKISTAEWKARYKSDNYRIIRKYCNDDIMVSAEWHGRSDDRIPPHSRKLFGLIVHNNVNGSWLKDVSLTETFTSIDEMLIAYETILLRYTESDLEEKEGDLVMVEVGNLLKEKTENEEDSESVNSEAEEKVGNIGGWS